MNVVELKLAVQPQPQVDVAPPETLCSRVCSSVLTPFRLIGLFFAWLLSPIIEFILKVSLYRSLAINSNCFARLVLEPVLQGVFNVWSKCRGSTMTMESVDPERLLRSENFIKQFAAFQTITTPDGKSLSFALFKPEALDQWIEAHGGEREGEWIRPKTPEDWASLSELREFRWFKEEGQAFKVPEKKADLADKCVLRIQGFGRTMPMDKAFIGAHLAMGISYAIFDWREGDLSSTGFFQDAETAYQALRRENYAPEHIIPMGSCRSTFIIGKLKEDHHAEGMNVVMVQSPPSLEQAIKRQNWLASFLGMTAIASVESSPGDYDTIARMSRLERQDRGGVCLILSEHDETLPPDTEAQFRSAAEKAGNLDFIFQQTEPGADAHLQEPLRDPIVFTRYTQFLQST